MKKILLIQLRQLGDILLTTPIVHSLHEYYQGNVEVHFLSHRMGKFILCDQPLLKKTWYLPETIGGYLEWILAIRQEKFDVVIDYMGNPRSAFLTWIINAPKRIGHKGARQWAYTDCMERQSGLDYIVQEKFRYLKALNIDQSFYSPKLLFYWSQEDLHYVQNEFEKIKNNLLQNFDRNARKPIFIAMSPTHRREDRRWEPKKWVELAKKLIENKHWHIIWVWGPGEFDEVAALHERVGRGSALAPKTSLKQLGALFSLLDACVTTSNGPSHVCISVDTPSLQLHGPTDMPSWCPLTPRHKGVQKIPLTALSVDEVYHQFITLLDD